MYWSTEDHHRHHQQNYYNNFQIVQPQNGIQQATAAVPPQQQQHPTPPPPLQQQQQHQQQQQVSHRAANQQMPPHYPTNQQMQHAAAHHQHQQWTTRPPILTAPPFFQQFNTTVPSSAQYCAAPAQYFHPQRVTQASAVSAPPPQRPCLPPGCAPYPMPPLAAALRQNVLSQPPATIMTPTTSSAQPMQVQYFSAPQYCQPPLGPQTYGHVIAPAIHETPVVKHRKHAIPIIDPHTKENIFERDLRRSESASPADALSITATASSTSTDLKETDNDLEEELQQIPTREPVVATEQTLAEHEVIENNEQIEDDEEDITDSSARTPAVVDHVESIEAKEDVEEEKEETTIEDINKNANDAEQTESISTTTTTTANEVEFKCSDDKSNSEETSIAEGNFPPTMEAMIEKSSTASTKAIAMANKQQQTQKQPIAPTKPSKKGKSRKRVKDSQKKQRADLMNNENNNNTNKTTNQNEHKQVKQTMTEPCNSNRLTAAVKPKENINNRTCSNKTEAVMAVPAECDTSGGNANGATSSCTPTSFVEDHEKSEENSDKIDDSTETSNTNDDNDHSSQLYDSPKLTKSEQIASEILGIESTDDNELLFLNSSVSGYEEDIYSSPTHEIPENDKANDILFGDFSQENPAQEVSMHKGDELQEEKDNNEAGDDDDDDDESPLSTPKEEKKFAYTLQELKSFASGPASKIPPTFRGDICDMIGKHPRGGGRAGGGGPAGHMQSAYQNQMYQQISYKDSMNYLNRKRNKRINDAPPYQQFQQQQYEQQQQRNPEIIRIHLSLNEEIQLAKSENAWVPAGLQNRAPRAESEDDEQILKKIRGILNKLTPENFDKLLQSTAKFPMTGEERMKKVMLLIFEKTVSEPNFAPTYARFCKFLFNPQNQNHQMFKTILIKRIQDEFENNVNNAKAKNAKLRPLMDRLAAATDPKEQSELKAELDDQEYQFRRRAWGTVRFIGEMFKLGFLAIERVCTCVENLLDHRCEEKLEYMCKLLTTVGAQLEPLVDKKQTGGGEQPKISERLDATFITIKHLVERKKSAGQKISSRVRFMMQDVLELRSRSWDQKVVPMLLPSREVSPAFTRGPPPTQRGLRMGSSYMQSGGYDKRRQTGDGQKNSPQQNIDVNKLPFFSKVELPRKLGNSSLLICKTTASFQQQSQQQTAPPTIQQNSRHMSRSTQPESKEITPPHQQVLSSRECERLINGLIEVAIEEESKKEWFAKWNEISHAHHPKIIYHLLTVYLHSTKIKRPEIDACRRLFTNLIKENLLSRSSFNEGYQNFSDECYEILVDVPMAWQYVFTFIGPLLHLKLIPFDMIWYSNWYNSSTGDKFLQSMIIHFTSEFGANYMRYFWESNSLRWDKFLAEDRLPLFIANNRFEFIANDKCSPPIYIQRSPDELVQRIKILLKQSHQDIDLIIDFISTNVHIDCSFIRNLTMFLCDYTVIYFNTPNSSSISSNSNKKSKLSDSSPSTSSISSSTATITTSSSSSYKLREERFITKGIPLLRLCIDSKDEHELSCLDAIVETCKQLYDSSAEDLICAMLSELYGEVISKESFEKWHQQQQLRAVGDDKLKNDLSIFFQKITNLPTITTATNK